MCKNHPQPILAVTIASRLYAWFIADGYLYDWIAAGILVIINHVVPGSAIHPVKRYYLPDDPTLSYPHQIAMLAPISLQENTISSAVLYILTFAWPGAVFVLGAVVQRSFADGHHALLSLLEGFALACGWKRWMNLVGRLRPNWLSVLQLNDSSEEKDARMSYPSGHSAYMFFSATILALWALGKFKVLSQPSQGLFLKLLVCIAPLWLATFVACTRISDYAHNPSDVNAGCFIGIACGTLAYHLNYPSALSQDCGQPKLRKREAPVKDERTSNGIAWWNAERGNESDGKGDAAGQA